MDPKKVLQEISFYLLKVIASVADTVTIHGTLQSHINVPNNYESHIFFFSFSNRLLL